MTFIYFPFINHIYATHSTWTSHQRGLLHSLKTVTLMHAEKPQADQEVEAH